MIKKILLLTLLSLPFPALTVYAQEAVVQPAPQTAVAAQETQNNQAQQNPAPKVNKDLPAIVLGKPKSALFGRQFEVEVELPTEAKLDLKAFDRKDFEIIKQTRNQINPRKVTLSVIAFNLGVLQFPQTTWVDARGNKFYSDTFRIETKPTKTKVKAQGLADIRPPFRPFNPWYLVLAAALAAAAFAFWRWYKNKKTPAQPANVTPYTSDNRPLHIIALEQIDNLLMEGLWESQHYKFFYIRLTDILRGYFSARFDIEAHRFTTRDLIKELKRCKEFKTDIDPVSVFLKEADYVKFAKVVPSAAERDAHIQNLRDIITETRQPLALQPSPDDVLKTDIKLFDLPDAKAGQNVKPGPEIEIIKSEKEFAQRLMDRTQGVKNLPASASKDSVSAPSAETEQKHSDEVKKEEDKAEKKQDMKELFLVSRQPSRPIDLKVKSALEKQGVKYGQMAEAYFSAPQVFKKTESEIKAEAEAAQKAEAAKTATQRTLP